MLISRLNLLLDSHTLFRAFTAFTLVTSTSTALGSFDREELEAATEIGNDENVLQKTAEATTDRRDALFPIDRDLAHSLRQAKQDLYERTGLKLAAESTTIYQLESNTGSDAAVHTAGLFGTWDIWVDPNSIDGMGIGFSLETRNNFSGNSFPEWVEEMGSLWSTNDATSETFDKMPQLWFAQQLASGKFFYLIGKVDPGAYMGGNRYAGSGNTQFFSQPLAGNPARAFPDNGLGMIGRWSPNDLWYLQGSLSDSDANSTDSPFATIEGNWHYAVEIVCKPYVKGWGEGRYRLLGYYRETTPESTFGWAISFDQDVSDDYGLFLRYGSNDGDAGPIQTVASTGISFRRPFMRNDDEAGIGLCWGQSSDDSGGDQYGCETYYRLQVTEFAELSGSAQLLLDPYASDENAIGVVGLRLRLLF